MRKKTTAILMLAAIVLAPSVMAGSSSAQMNVSVQVIARTIVTVDSQPASVDTHNGVIEIALGFAIFAIVGMLGTMHPATHLF